MRQPLRKSMKLTEGERARALAFVLAGVCSAVLGYLAVLHLDQNVLFGKMTWYQRWTVVASGFGGMCALFLSGDRMGQAGVCGTMCSVAGAVWVTFIGALIGGTLALPLYGTMFGPFIVTVTLLGAPMLAVLWVVNLACIHILLGTWQRERDSIFESVCKPRTDDQATLRPPMRGRFT